MSNRNKNYRVKFFSHISDRKHTLKSAQELANHLNDKYGDGCAKVVKIKNKKSGK